MGALSDLLKQSPTVATPATPATQASAAVRAAAVSRESQESQGGTEEMRARLLTLAAMEGLPAATVHRLHANDVTACHGLPDDTLRAYLGALNRTATIREGIAPPDYTQTAHCDGCGPIWLWEGAPARVGACPWCFRRKAGNSLPRPPVTCGGCRHFLPNRLNPIAGCGGCALGPDRGYWPMRRHVCTDHAPTENNAEQRLSQMITYSVEAQS